MSRILVALDVPTIEAARALAIPLVDEVGGFKVGLELITGVGPSAIAEIAALGKPVFADAKLHDIPTTVEAAANRLAAAGARWVTVHASGGAAMIAAANVGMGGSGVLAVTVLTSFAEDDLLAIGVTGDVDHHVVHLAGLAEAAGAEGAVCAPGDVGAVRGGGVTLKLFTPGVRLETAPTHDQKRVGTPVAAVEAGADYLVIGRPITQSADPVEATRRISASIARFD